MRIIVKQNITNIKVVPNGASRNNIVVGQAPTYVNILVNNNGGNGGGGGVPGYTSAGTSMISLGTVVFSNSNNAQFGLNGNVVTASFDQTVQPQTSLVYSNSNNVSFGINGATITASASFPAGGGGGTISAGTNSISLGQLVFSNSNSVSFGLNGSTLTASFSQSSQAQSSLVFSNSNNVTFGTNGSTITASASFNQAVQSAYLFSNSNNVSFGSNGSTVTASASFNQSAFLLSASNGISFGTNGSTVTASYTVPSVTEYQFISNSSLSLGTGATASFRFTSADSQLQFTSANSNFLGTGATASFRFTSNDSQLQFTSANSNFLGTAATASFRFTSNDSQLRFTSADSQLQFTSANSNFLGTAATQSFRFTSADSQLQFTSANSNFLGTAATQSFRFTSQNSQLQFTSANTNFVQATAVFNGTNASGTIASGGISISVAAQGLTSQSNQAFSASGGSSAFQTLNFANSNGFTFSNSNGSVIASYSVPSTAGLISAINLSAGTTSNNLTAFVLSNSNGLSFGLSGSTITGSYTVPTQSNQNISLYALGNTTQNSSTVLNASQISFNGGGIVTVGFSNGSIQFSASATAAPSPVNFSAGTTSGNLASVVFSNSNGVSFGLNGGTITASAAGGGGGIALANSQTTFSSGTIAMSASGALTIGSAAQQFNFSVPQTSSLSATGQVSISVNGATVSIGVPNPSTRSGYSPYGDIPLVEGALGQGVLIFDPEGMPNVQFDRIQFIANISNAVNSSGSQTLSAWFGYYTRNASSLSLLSSVSASYAMTQSGTAGSYSLFGGMRGFTMGMTNTITDGQYWFGFVSRSTSGGANITLNNILISNINSVFSGFFGVASNTSAQRTIGNGIYSATTSGMPSVVAFSEINGQSSIGWRFPIIQLASSTV